MQAGTETGSLINHVMTEAQQKEPQVGDGVTICQWTDRKAGTIVRLTRCTIEVQQDTAKRTDENGMSEDQAYEYAPNPNGKLHTFRKTKKGWKDGDGNGLLIGARRAYHDYSF
jgi:hypothetical protein